jgi:hypothetical protein
MLERLCDYDWEQAFGYVGEAGTEAGEKRASWAISRDNPQTPPLYEDPIEREDVSAIIAIEDGANDEADWIGLFKLKNGLFLGLEAGCDYTGWD